MVSFAMESLTNTLPSTVKSLHADGITNFFQVTPSIYSGSAPENRIGFDELKNLGIKTIISVDGAKPDVAMAKSFGLRYVQIPIGYDGVPTEQAVRLVKAIETLPGPFYIHCHHGIHRGPAAVAVICEAEAGWSPQEAITWMTKAGTDTNYSGLFKSVATFKKPSSNELAMTGTGFPPILSKSRLADEMVKIDSQYDTLKNTSDPSTLTPPSRKREVEQNSVLLLLELFKEIPRTGGIEGRDSMFISMLTNATSDTKALYATLGNNGKERNIREQIALLKHDCQQCHQKFRN